MAVDEEKQKKNSANNDDGGDDDAGDGDQAQPPPPSGAAGEQSKALGSLSTAAAHEDEKEIDADSAAKAAQGVHSLQQAVQRQKERAAERERALAAVKVAAPDVDAVAAEFDLKRPEAERCLREAGGDLKKALSKLCGAATDL
jgi:NACalpha-BTF3-like transcription factor